MLLTNIIVGASIILGLFVVTAVCGALIQRSRKEK